MGTIKTIFKHKVTWINNCRDILYKFLLIVNQSYDPISDITSFKLFMS